MSIELSKIKIAEIKAKISINQVFTYGVYSLVLNQNDAVLYKDGVLIRRLSGYADDFALMIYNVVRFPDEGNEIILDFLSNKSYNRTNLIQVWSHCSYMGYDTKLCLIKKTKYCELGIYNRQQLNAIESSIKQWIKGKDRVLLKVRLDNKVFGVCTVCITDKGLSVNLDYTLIDEYIWGSSETLLPLCLTHAIMHGNGVKAVESWLRLYEIF